MKKVWQSLVRLTFRSLMFTLRFMPWKIANAWAAAMGLLGYRMSARYRAMADKNLRIAYGDSLSQAERDRITRRVFQNFARAVLVEFLKAPSMKPDALRRKVIVDDWSLVDEILARGKGMIMVTAHFGNFELLARRAALEGYSFAVVARQSPDPGFNEITDSIRESGGYTVHARGDSPKGLLQRLRKGGIIAILPDQKSEDVFVPFFGQVAGTVAGPAVLALKTGAPILPMFCTYQNDGTYNVTIGPEIDIHSTGNTDEDSHRIMADITKLIEDNVRAHPDQWLWLHDRWKMPPPERMPASLKNVVRT